MGRRPTSEETRQRAARLVEELTKARTQAGWSQDELARAADVAVDSLRRIEQRVTLEPGFFTVSDLAVALEMDLDRLFRRTRRLPVKASVRSRGTRQ